MIPDNIRGLMKGRVTNNEDPDNLGRVKVALQLTGEEAVETDWIPVLSIYHGLYFIPEINDNVAIAAMDNSDSYIVIGSLWTPTQQPPVTGENTESDLNKDGENNLKFIQSRSGHQVILDDKEGDEKIQLITSDKSARIEYLGKDKKIKIQTGGDLVIEASKNLSFKSETIKFEASKGVKLEGDEALLKSSGKDIQLKSGKNISLDGNTVKLN